MKVFTAEKDSLYGELECAEFLCRATHCNADIYSFDGAVAPLLLEEVCRLRRESYRGVGVALDDRADDDSVDRDGTYRQLIVWDRDRKEIVGGYRYAVGCEARVERLSLNRYMSLSKGFVERYLPRGIELGRSFVSPRYQSGDNTLTIYALDALWEGLAELVRRQHTEYLFGRVTLYDTLGAKARNVLVGYMQYTSPVKESLMVARAPYKVGISRRRYSEIFIGKTAQENYRILLSQMREMGRRIPPVISSYLRLSPTLKLFDSYKNYDLGGVIESAIMLTVSEFYESVKNRYNI
ncbi:MAG: GNAT family N-acetyltransferase [Alistipes sp.]|nr:GNAT family N-acetyltransferase [Alistipes sp.]